VFCGLQRDGSGKLNFGSDGLPVPICVASTDANAAACGRPGIKPQPANFTGGSGGSQGWTAVQLSGILPNGSSAGVIASIGSDGYSGGSAYFAGNGSDATVVVKVLHCGARLYFCQRITVLVQFIVSAVADSVLQCVLFSHAPAIFSDVLVIQHLLMHSCLNLSCASGSVLLRARYQPDGCYHLFFQ
jgi:hypothetical protein